MSSGARWYLCLSALSIAAGQPAGFEGRTVTRVEFQPAGVLDPADLARVESVKAGSVLRSEDVADEIDRLFATGEFENIRAEAEPSGADVTVRFVTVPKRYISGLRIEGKVSDPPNRGEISSSPQLDRGNVFSEQDYSRAVDSIRQLLESNGLYRATVTPAQKADASGQQIFLTLTLHSGKRARYEQPIVHGDDSLSANTIARATGWRVRFIKRWRSVTAARTMTGLQGILKKYQSEDHLAAQAEVERLDYDSGRHRVQPTLNLDAGPRIKVTATETKVPHKVLKRYVPVFDEGAIDNDLLAEGARNLRGYFESQGYFDATVDFRTEMPKDGEETVDFAISKGQRYRLAHLSIAGNRYFHEDTIRDRMFMEPSSFHLRHGRYSEAFRKKDEDNITNLYLSNGFRDVKVSAQRVPDQHGKADEIGVVVQIQEGDQWMIDSVALNGFSDSQKAALEPMLASAEGQPFSDAGLAADRTAVLTYFGERGYPTADFKAEWKPSAAPHHVNVIYTVTPGQQEFVRQIIITGLNQTRRKLIDQRMTLHAGDPLSDVQQRNIQKSLYDMGVFARVDTAIENPDGGTSHKNLLFAFDEANRYAVTVGVGAQVGRFGTPSTSTISAAGGATGFSPQFAVNASRLNFLGIGHTVSIRGAYSTLEKRASASYFAPRFQNIEGRSLTFSILYDQTLDVRTFASVREEASVQVSQRFSRGTTGLFRFAYRRVSVSDVVIPVLLIPQLVQSVRIGIVSANIARDHRDNSSDPHRGSYSTADLGIASSYLGSQRNFGRALIRNATYYRLSRNVVLARQTQFGVIVPFNAPAGLTDQQSVPLPERFFGGGADSLRAFPFNQAGPRDTGAPLTPGGPSSAATGFPLGGNALVFNNVELRFPFIGENIQGVLFHDMGNVYSTFSNISFRFHQRDNNDFDYGVHAVGFGIRYRTPVGPVRLDLAYSINPPSYLGFSGTAVQLLQCGANSTAANCQSTQQNVSHFQFFFSIGQTF